MEQPIRQIPPAFFIPGTRVIQLKKIGNDFECPRFGTVLTGSEESRASRIKFDNIDPEGCWPAIQRISGAYLERVELFALASEIRDDWQEEFVVRL